MKYLYRILLLLSVICTMVLLNGTAQAALKAVGPVDPVTSIPSYYQDLTSLPLQPCLDQNGMCLLPPPFDILSVPMSPITTTGPISNANFPGEGFYYSAVAILPIETGELANLAYVLEYAFLAGVSPNTAIVFLRTDLQKMINLTPNSTYRVTHPYGTFDFTTDGIGNARGGGGVVLRQEDPPGGAGAPVNYFTPSMQAATNTNIGPFLRPADGIPVIRTVGIETHTYIGDPAATTLVNGVPTLGVPVIGGPNGNILKIDRIVTGGTPKSPQSTWSTNLWSLMGRVFTGTAASPMTIDRATYARDATSGQIDIFATAETLATLTLSGTGITSTPLAEDFPNTGQYFVHVPFATTLPSALSITNSLDYPSPVAHPITLVDEVKISMAEFNPVNRNLTIKADSRDNLAPLPVLTAPQFAVPNILDATGMLVTAIPPTTIPPKTVTVTSSRGGSSTIPISVVTQVPPPVAVNDSASTSKGVVVSIDVIANDTTAGILDPTSVTIVASPASGATVVPAGNGSVLYTPTATFTGTETFAYTVKDTLGQTSNVATVSVLVNTPPVAVNDTATAVISTTVNINVVGNDNASNSAINATTVNIVSPATCGTIAVLGNGTVNFTAPATTGTCSFSYVVSDTFVPPAISNVATVTVTVTPPAPPVAQNDVAATLTSSPVVINVVANDTSSGSTINPASIVVTAPTGGTAVANVNGTVSYTAPAAPGTYTFTYTVKDNNVPALTSNAATVSVTVTAPFVFPTAVNDSAVVPAGGSIVINVATNDIAGTTALDPASVAVVTPPAHGTATVNLSGPGTVTYTPTVGFSGNDSFTYNIKDTLGNVSANSATVAISVTTPAPTETITVTRAQFTLSTASWRIDGSSNAPIAGQTMKIFNSATVPANGTTGLLATVTVAAGGSFTWSSPNASPAPNGLRKISILSSKNPNNNKVEQVTVTVR
jgi:hypothetical protein